MWFVVSQYVEAAKTLGLRSTVVVLRHVIPNAVKPVLVLATIGIGQKNPPAGAAFEFPGAWCTGSGA